MSVPPVKFVRNKSTETAKHIFMDVEVDVAKILESWQESLFSFEWMTPEGEIKPLDELSSRERPKRIAVEEQIKKNMEIERPVLGMGLSDHVEIGSGRAVFMTLADHGYKTLPVHIPKSNEGDFKKFIVKKA